MAFAQVVHPVWPAGAPPPMDVIATVNVMWHRLYDLYRSTVPTARVGNGSGMKRGRGASARKGSGNGSGVVAKARPDSARPWPFPRQLYHAPPADRGFIVPIAGIDGSYLTQLIACPLVLGSPEHAAVSILCELLSRTEGRLYMAVRGKGHAYGADVSYYRWSGQLAFTCREATAPEHGVDLSRPRAPGDAGLR